MNSPGFKTFGGVVITDGLQISYNSRHSESLCTAGHWCVYYLGALVTLALI